MVLRTGAGLWKVLFSRSFTRKFNHTSHFSGYDCIGFDLDNTLCEYKVNALVPLEYDVLSSFLVKKGYSARWLKSRLDEAAVDFMQRGLLLDFEKGTVIKLRHDGRVLKACHGLKQLSDHDVADLYGQDRMCPFYKLLDGDLTNAWKPELLGKFRLVMDVFDLPAALAFARCVEFMKGEGVKDYTDSGLDTISGLRHMYNRENFSTGESEYFRELISSPSQLIEPCNEKVIEWLKISKKDKFVFLVTGSNADHANLTATTCLGPNWQELFHVVVCFARKPMFFTQQNPFLVVEGYQEINEKVSPQTTGIYSQGSFIQLMEAYKRDSRHASNVRVVYVGDNVVQDIYAPVKGSKTDSIAILPELDPCVSPFLASKFWRPMFAEGTLWERVVRECSQSTFCSVHEAVIS